MLRANDRSGFVARDLSDSVFFVEQAGTSSGFRGVRETIEGHGLFASLYTDGTGPRPGASLGLPRRPAPRGAWLTPEAGGKVDKTQLTQFGRALGLGYPDDCGLFP